ncbi:MAG: SpoIIE family protein phosphatase [Candidatus Riflebacteria bacterium]|nr:SpoIIE family protein phosphatase [Candidatus Riflebacteria bacterium]
MISTQVNKKILWVFSIVVFFLFPVLLTLYGTMSYLEEVEQESRNKAISQQEQILLRLRKNEETHEYLSVLLAKIHYFLINRSYKKLDFALADLHKRFPGMVKLYLVDSDGEVRKELSEPNAPEYLLKKLHYCVFQPTNEMLLANRKLFQSFIGSEVMIEHLWKANSARIVPSSSGNERRWFFFRISERGAVFAHIKEVENWSDLAMKDRIRSYLQRKGHPYFQIGITPIGSTMPSAPVSTALVNHQKKSRNSFQFENMLVYVARLKSSSLLWIAFSRKKYEVTHNLQNLIYVLSIVIFLLLSYVSAKFNFNGAKIFFSIKWRLIALFFYASLLPLLIIFSVVWKYLAKEYDFSKTRCFETAEQILRNIDLSFPLLRISLQKEIYEHTSFLNYNYLKDTKKTENLLKNLANKLTADKIYLFDAKGNTVYAVSGVENLLPPDMENPRENIVDRSTTKAIAEVSSAIIGKLNLDESNFKMLNSIETLSVVTGINLLHSFAKAIGRLEEFKVGSDVSWIMFSTIKDDSNKITHMLVFFWDKHQLEKTYLEYFLKRKNKLSGNVKIIAADTEYLSASASANIIESTSKSESSGYFFSRNLSKKANSFIPWIDIWQTTINRILYDSSHTYFFTGIKPKEIKYYYLLALQNDHPVRKRISSLKKYLFAFAFGCIIISVFIGKLLSEKLLKPIDNLGSGVKAIENKNFRFKVPVIESDELGTLTEMFNSMLGNLEEVNLARKVQKQLFPDSPLKLGKYCVNGKSLSATELGGDYFDYFSYKDRYLFAVIGDVTGHGVPAALVMAMAKAVVNERLFSGDTLTEIIPILNATLLRNLKKKILMTATFFSIDTLNDEILYYNCGHPFPFLRKSDGSLQMIENAGLIMGLREKFPLFPKKVSLEKGDRIILYTDGMVESFPPVSSLSNFDVFQDYLATRPILNSEKACDDYINNHPHVLSLQPLPDDFSILQIEKTE